MKKIVGLIGALLSITLLAIVLIPKSEAGAAVPSDNFKMEGSTLVAYIGMDKNVTIPSTVETIGRSAFENNTFVESVVVPESVETIEPYAFWGCSKLKSVTLGNGLYEVGDFTFTDCRLLESVSLADSIRRIGIMAFADCPSLQNIQLSSYINDIHETAFDGNKNLTISAMVGSYAYDYAQEFAKKQEDMADVAIPTPEPTPTPIAKSEATPVPGEVIGQSQVVGNMAFVFWDKDVTVGVGEYEPDYNAEGEQNLNNGEILIQDGAVKEWSYYTNEELTEVNLPEGTEKVEQFAFSRSSLQKIVLPEGLTTIDYAAFYHCDQLTEVEIPATVTRIESKAFSYTPWLQSFLDGDNPQQGDFLIVGDGVLLAYRGNSRIIEIPDEVNYIADEVFLNHTEILNVVYPEDKIIEIAPTAFEGCTKIKE
ncbi:MAG: leucine-rich repeat domain-containing protein [Lachnospiraceae bacterium]|nr:leucine-rich repeat domain-containing protein [Lachnospiraceae bacterium]